MSGNIVIVDDDVIITKSISMLVKYTMKLDVTVFNDPLQALEHIRSAGSDIEMLISDFMMPSMSGTELISKMKEIRPDAVYILLTGYADKKSAIDSINSLGLYYYLEKPWDNDVLIKVITNGLEKKRLSDDIKHKVIELQESNNKIDNLYKLLEKEYQKEISRSETLEQLVQLRTASLRNLLDNAGQGFLSFGPDLLVDREYSAICTELLGDDIEGCKISDLLNCIEINSESLETILKKIMSENDSLSLDAFSSLLPERYTLKDRILEVDFRIIQSTLDGNAPQMMAILTDVTEKANMENRMQDEKEKLKMVVKVLQNQNMFLACMRDFREFCRTAENMVLKRSTMDREFTNNFLRVIHTYKGNFGIFNLFNLTAFLHAAETEIASMNNGTCTPDNIRAIVSESRINEIIEKDLRILKETLGENFFEREGRINISSSQLSDIENAIRNTLDKEAQKAILPMLGKLRHIPLKRLLSYYPDYTISLAERLEKHIKPFSIDGDEILVDQEKYLEFSKSLIHVFRNAVVHSLEDVEERMEQGKPDAGSITCTIRQGAPEGGFSIIISDDGRGIQMEDIRRKSVENGLYTFEEASGLDNEQLLKLLFEDGFSTSSGVSELSGRGFGLSAVSKEVMKLSGSIQVENAPYKGAKFIFKF